jgi:serine/threonine protein kinase
MVSTDCNKTSTKYSMKGKILGSRYKIIEYLAEGGFGRTYLAEDTQMPGDNICVVKQLYPSSCDPQRLAVARRLFKTEASTLHNLGHHQQIPKLLAYFEEEEKFYLVQQYIKGSTLAKELNLEQTWSEEQVIELLRDGLNILQFIHDQQVIHRDVKPDNLIRRDCDGRIVLVDFGTVKEVLQEQQTHLGQLTIPVGTQGYMPTEQARGKPRPTSDVYALGIIGIQALTGIAPLDIPEDDEGELIWESAVHVSQELSKILTCMTRYHFKDRYSSARDALLALDELPQVATNIQSAIINPSETINQPLINNGVAVGAASSVLEDIPVAIAVDRPNPFNFNSFSTATENQTETLTHKNFQAIATDDKKFYRVINPQPTRQPPLKTKNKNIIGLLITLVVLSVVGIGTYLFMHQSISESEINSPSNELETQPNSTKRVKQGAGFRKNL